MKKKIIALFVLAAASFGVYWFAFRKSEKADGPKAKPMEVAANTDAFTGQFNQLLNTYYAMSGGFTKGNAGEADLAAQQLRYQLDSLDLKTLKADSMLIQTAQGSKESILAELNALTAEKDLENKRRSFQTISDALYDLVRIVQYNGATVYQLNCPMAFNNAGANWLSNDTIIKNPYFGEKMPECGSVVDSLRFTPSAASVQ